MPKTARKTAAVIIAEDGALMLFSADPCSGQQFDCLDYYRWDEILATLARWVAQYDIPSESVTKAMTNVAASFAEIED